MHAPLSKWIHVPQMHSARFAHYLSAFFHQGVFRTRGSTPNSKGGTSFQIPDCLLYERIPPGHQS